MGTHHKIVGGWLVITLLAVGALPASAGIAPVNKSVAATQGPWLYTVGGLNSAFQYGVGDATTPTIVSSADGLVFTPGSMLSVQYLGGTVSGHPASVPFTDANGDTSNAVNNTLEPTGGKFPSFYFNVADYPAYADELVGTFADSSGQIVGTPFKIGDSRSLTVPAGATRLQLGINDTAFSDNAGSFNLSISAAPAASAVPLPPAAWPVLAVIGGIGLVFAIRRSGRPAM